MDSGNGACISEIWNLNELHGGPAHLDVQTASNLDLAKVRDHKLIRHHCQEYACATTEIRLGWQAGVP
jgi:hypothetical protein